MRILVVPDKFKGSLGAAEVGAAIAAGLRTALPAAEIEVVPLADGGEGTSEAICRARRGTWVDCPAHDAVGRRVTTRYAWLADARLAAMEMSAAAGLWRLALDERDPVRATSFGVGEMLCDAAARGASEIILGIGGSATNDGGFGMARALGYRFLAAKGRELSGPTTDLLELERIELPNEPFKPQVLAACDVDNPLLGPNGATRVFSAQKGATPQQMEILETALTRLADVASLTFARDLRDQPGAGAAGGLGFGLLTFCAATIRSGFEVVAEAIELRERIKRAEIVITGEGKLDRQTLSGKAPAGVARMARAAGKPVFAIVGQAPDDSEAGRIFEQVVTLDDTSPGYCETSRLLQEKAHLLGASWRWSGPRP